MNFKKCTSLFLALLLLVSNLGLAFNVHYCAGEIASVTSIYNLGKACEMEAAPVEKACCAKKAVIVKKTCCSDKIVSLQDKSDDIVVKAFAFEVAAPFVIPQWNALIFTPAGLFKKPQITSYFCDANAPPIFKLYSQYIFYA